MMSKIAGDDSGTNDDDNHDEDGDVENSCF